MTRGSSRQVENLSLGRGFVAPLGRIVPDNLQEPQRIGTNMARPTVHRS